MLPMLLRKPRQLSLHLRRSNGQSLVRSSSAEHRPQPPQEQPSRERRSNSQVLFSLSGSGSFLALQDTMWMRFGRDRRGFGSSSGSDDETKAETKSGNERALAASGVDAEEFESGCQVIEEMFKSERDLESSLQQGEIRLSSDLVVAVLGRFKNAGRPAFRFFRWASKKPGFSHDLRTYNAMVGILGRTMEFHTMVLMLEEMGERQLLTMHTFDIAIRAFGAANKTEKAEAVFELMNKYNFEVGIGIHNSLLDSLCLAGLVKETLVYFNKLKERFPPNLQTYTVLLRVWCEVKDLAKAGLLWNKMTELGPMPDVIAHNVMLQGLLDVKKRSEAIKLFRNMKFNGPAPNITTYTIMIRDYCRRDIIEEVMEYFDDMVGSGIKPNIAVYTSLITVFGFETDTSMIHKILDEMKMDERLYNTLARMMSIRRYPKHAAMMYKRMVRSGVEPTVQTYNTVMKACFEASSFEMGRAAWVEMTREGRCCPDENSYAVFISGLASEGRVEDAFWYLEKMLEKGMQASTLDYAKLAEDFYEAGRVDLLGEMAQKMRSAGMVSVLDVFAKWTEMVSEN